MRKHLCLWLVGSAVAFLPALAHAEDEPKAYPECTKAPTEAETAAAKGAYQAGNASFDEADYPRAITYWEDAYRRDCTANLLLKNLARAYELYGQKRQAVVALETFLVREPNSGDKEQIQRRIEVLKKQIAAEKTAPVATGSTSPATAVSPAQPSPASPATQPPSDVAPTANGPRPIYPLFVAGAGAAALIVGLVLYIPAAHDVSNFEKLCPEMGGSNMCNDANKQKTADDANSAQHKKVAGEVVTAVGAAALAGGLVWYFVQPRKAESVAHLERPRLSPALSPGFAGVALSGAF